MPEHQPDGHVVVVMEDVVEEHHVAAEFDLHLTAGSIKIVK